MRPDIVNLRQFYSSRLGRKVKARLRRIVREHWHQPDGVILGIGYATPLLRGLERAGTKSLPVTALMPVEQGAIYWPVHAENRSVLGDAMRPPFATNSLSYILVAHALEHEAAPQEFLAVLWQLLAPGGRLLLIVPNARGLWARFGFTPFASGTPYRLSTLKTLLAAADFTLREVTTALYAPPSEHGFWLRGWFLFEWLGRLLFLRQSGVLVVEAEKQIYAAVGERVKRHARAHWHGVPA